MAKSYMPDRRVAQRYGVHITTLYRWDLNPQLDFPKPIRINNRKYRDVEQLNAWDRSRGLEGSVSDQCVERGDGDNETRSAAETAGRAVQR